MSPSIAFAWCVCFMLISGGIAAAEEWKPLFEGIERRSIERSEPRPIVAHALRVDLWAEGVEIMATPSNGEAPGETDGLKTSTFLAKMKCQAAVNASPFAPIHLQEGKAQDVAGLMISGGKVVSPADADRPVLAFTAKNEARVVDRLAEPEGVQVAVVGFSIVLRDGEVKGAAQPLHPRTAAAISKDGRYLFLLTVDGRQKGYSEGVSTRELGAMLKELGGWDGINLDGGGTTTMVVEGADGEPEIINRPINGGIPGFERVSASHLGVRARGLKK